MKNILKNDVQLGEYIADQVEELISKKADALISIAAGTSSLPVFEALISRVKAGRLTFSQASFMAMDEWLHFSIEEDGSMGDFLTKYFLKHVDFRNIFLFDGMASDCDAECLRSESYISEHGGIDYIIYGIGLNGHIALNEPGSDIHERTHVVKVDNITANEALKYFNHTDVDLIEGITLGVANALEARKVVLIANTTSKHDIINKFEKSTPNSFLPASFLKGKDGFELLITQNVEEG